MRLLSVMTTMTMGCIVALLSSFGCVQDSRATSGGPSALKGHGKKTVALLWERQYGVQPGYWYTCQSAVVSPSGEVVLAVLADDVETPNGPLNHLSVVIFDAAGNLVSDFAVPKPEHDAEGRPVRSSVSENIFINVLKSGEICLAGNIVENRPWLMVLKRNGQVLLSRPIANPGRRIRVTNMIRAGDDHFLMLGEEGLDSLAMKIDASGQTIWEIFRDRGAADFFVDGVTTREGGTLLVENSGQYNILGMGPSSLIVGYYDANGKCSAETRLPGRHGSVAVVPNGTYVLVYDRDTGAGQDIWVAGLDHGLKELWSRSLVKVDRSTMRPGFHATGPADSGVIIGGGKAGLPYLGQFDSEGSIGWVLSLDTMAPSDQYEVVSDSASVFVVSTVAGAGDSGTKVRILRIGTGP